MKTLSPANKRDRVRMARMLADIVTECGATATEGPSLDGVGLSVRIIAARGVTVGIQIDRDCRKYGYLFPWNSDARLASGTWLGDVNRYHRMKATGHTVTFDGACTMLRGALNAVRDGTAFDDSDELRHAHNALRGIISECELIQANTRPAVNLSRVVALCTDALRGAQ